ncbi:hypothetical protein DN752_23240 [Echinicola strongylocentroti]|uniref:Glycosyl-4,4'-diaponeurosporenoate acyltransferase n=2 Tax=Echinicola strongylocentroti TaxID=1795355 RepID=A0A2Z4IPX9_9BACT|nr:hypothetical protein DN752_23240 [Echinicola strongylocentroti]
MVCHWTKGHLLHSRYGKLFLFNGNKWEKWIALNWFEKFISYFPLEYMEYQMMYGKNQNRISLEEIKIKHFTREFEYLIATVVLAGITLFIFFTGSQLFFYLLVMANLLGNFYPFLIHQRTRRKLEKRNCSLRKPKEHPSIS